MACVSINFCKRLLTRRPLSLNVRRFVSFNVSSPKEFEENVLQSERPVIVDFHASWCGPCKQLGPDLDSVIGRYVDQVDLAKVDVDELQDLALEYGVMSVPTVIGMKNGRITGQFIGAKDIDEIDQFVQKLLKE